VGILGQKSFQRENLSEITFWTPWRTTIWLLYFEEAEISTARDTRLDKREEIQLIKCGVVCKTYSTTGRKGWVEIKNNKNHSRKRVIESIIEGGRKRGNFH